METNIPIEQAIIPESKRKHTTIKKSVRNEKQESLTNLDNGPMLTTSEILDFSSGIDSTEYDQPKGTS